MHAAGPDVEETMKWSFPHFDYKDQMMSSMAASEANSDATRLKRMTTAVEWLSEGKTRNWKYEPK